MFIHELINYELIRIKIGERRCDIIVETPIPKANNLKVTIGVAELVS